MLLTRHSSFSHNQALGEEKRKGKKEKSLILPAHAVFVLALEIFGSKKKGEGGASFGCRRLDRV